VHRNPIGADCFFEREQRSTSSTNERLQIVPRVSAGLSKKPHAGRVQQRIQHLLEVLSKKIIVAQSRMSWRGLSSQRAVRTDAADGGDTRRDFDVPISRSPLKRSQISVTRITDPPAFV
jgi:septum formation topological specificity factor MinE